MNSTSTRHFKDMSNQDIFNIVWNGAKSNGFLRSMSVSGGCYYRHPNNGSKCAAGWLIPDDVDLNHMNSSIVSETPFFSDNFTVDQLKFLERLQDVHDNSTSSEKYRDGLVVFAKERGLSITE